MKVQTLWRRNKI